MPAMMRWTSSRGRLRGFLGSLIGLLAVAYFSYHAIQGDRGLLAHARLKGEIAEARAKLAALKREEAALQARVDRLSPHGLDRDLLDEQARAMFNRIRPEERILRLDDLPPAPSPAPDVN